MLNAHIYRATLDLDLTQHGLAVACIIHTLTV